MKRTERCRILLVILAAALSLAAQERALIAPERLEKHIRFLASAAMKGRGTGTPELEQAAEYIAKHFRAVGLAPAFGKTYFQKFRVTVGAELGPQNRASTDRGSGAPLETLKVGQDFLPLNFSDSGQAEVPLVFAGYGISSEEHRYDDYLHFDVQDKAVIVLRHEPQEDDEKSVFAGRELTPHAQIVNKAINARLHGARAMVLVNDPVPHAGEADQLIRFGALAGPDNAGLLLIQVRREVVDRWLRPSGKTLAQLQRAIDEKLLPQSFYVPEARLKLEIDVRRVSAETRNVAGLLRGSDPKLAAEAIIIGAHYDHLGLGRRYSLEPAQAGQVHPGADDNASGTAAMLELARELAGQRRELRRSILLVAFAGEELGLLGSSHYTKNPAWPLERTAAMINLDMVGRPRENKIYVGGVGTSPGFKDIVGRANVGEMEISYSAGGASGSSDHASFYVKDIPVLFFFSGLHADYHKPTDTAERIQMADAARVWEIVFGVARTLARLEERPAFARVAEPRPPLGAGGGSGYGPYFGSIPDMGESVNGVKFAGVSEGSPAAQAGLKAGDILVEFAGKPIQNLYDFTYALRSHRPGEEVQVTVLRGQERVTVTVKLAERK